MEEEKWKNELVAKVKEVQRRSPGHKAAWHKFCKMIGNQDMDPNTCTRSSSTYPERHFPETLQQFINAIEDGTIKPIDEGPPVPAWVKGCGKDPAWGKDPWGKGFVYDRYGGKSGADWLGGSTWTPDNWVDPWTAMAMKGKDSMKGKGMMPGDWICQACGDHQFAKNVTCRSCGAPRPPGAGKGKDSGAIFGSDIPEDAERIGEIRFDNPDHARLALETLDGSELQGSVISVQRDPRSQDGTKLMVTGLPSCVEWQELKDHFKEAGMVAYAGIRLEVPAAGILKSRPASSVATPKASPAVKAASRVIPAAESIPDTAEISGSDENPASAATASLQELRRLEKEHSSLVETIQQLEAELAEARSMEAELHAQIEEARDQFEAASSKAAEAWASAPPSGSWAWGAKGKKGTTKGYSPW